MEASAGQGYMHKADEVMVPPPLPLGLLGHYAVCLYGLCISILYGIVRMWQRRNGTEGILFQGAVGIGWIFVLDVSFSTFYLILSLFEAFVALKILCIGDWVVVLIVLCDFYLHVDSRILYQTNLACAFTSHVNRQS